MSSNDLILTMGTAYRGAMDIIREAMPKKEKQSTLALSILLYVDKTPGVSQGQLGKILRRDPMTMSQAVRALQNAALVESKPDEEDRRIKRLAATKKGRLFSQNILEGETKLMQALAKEWGKGRLNSFTKDVVEFNYFLSKLRGEIDED